MPSSPGAFQEYLPLWESLKDDNFSMSSALHEVNGKVSHKPCVYRIWCNQTILWVHLISQSFHFWLRSNCSSFYRSLFQRNASYSWGTNYLHTGIKALYAVKGWVLGRNTSKNPKEVLVSYRGGEREKFINKLACINSGLGETGIEVT